MSKSLLGVALLLLAGCGGVEQSAVFGDEGPTGSGGHAGAAVLPAGGTGQPNGAIGSGGAPVAGGEPSGVSAATTQGGSLMAGSDAGGMVSSGGSAGGLSSGGAAQGGSGGASAAGGAAQGGTQQGGKSGAAGSSGSVGIGGAAFCQDNVSKDCDGKPENGCEVYLCDRNNCGECGRKCFSSEQCVCKGSIPNFLYYCGNP